ncbi:hypothetical protein P171DRAFT_446718 [Karstenula rhodostoma CBS 690.94]|uniref:Uncharacterized protein n=1 Tax=Karstenula rhodostoma CBS 690.94 TaxID=1392251 RepID=A0A9P4PFC4_9PLEO|nr:hypothetical protein P171DRAFT_446718 [Karstenula rhodostoma CBS 690.94]
MFNFMFSMLGNRGDTVERNAAASTKLSLVITFDLTLPATLPRFESSETASMQPPHSKVFKMYTTIYLFVSSILAGLAQARTVQNAGLASRDGCRIGEAGGFFINILEPGQADHNRTYSANEAAHPNCLKMNRILEDLVGSEKKQFYINRISPFSGGYCQLYESDNCDGDAMELLNPKNLKLTYPEYVTF